jgi:nicotinamide-nucleotide amidase
VLDNDHGLAVGTAIDDKDKIYILLPGPPREMKPMFNQYAVPWILDKHPQLKPLVSKMFCFAGIGESAVAEKLDDLIKTQSDPTIATYAKEGEVIVRLASKNENSFAPIERVIRKRLESFIIDDSETTIEQALIEKCIRIGKKIVVAESCTGGWITQLITSIPGASQVLHSGIVTYTNQAKSDMLNVPPDVLFGESAPGAVSKETVCIMAEHALNQSNADYAVATTGVAGPSESEDKPVGLVYIAVASKGGNTEVVEYRTSGTRNMIQRRSAKHALFKLWQII